MSKFTSGDLVKIKPILSKYNLSAWKHHEVHIGMVIEEYLPTWHSASPRCKVFTEFGIFDFDNGRLIHTGYADETVPAETG